jgi:hypothetical protein
MTTKRNAKKALTTMSMAQGKTVTVRSSVASSVSPS